MSGGDVPEEGGPSQTNVFGEAPPPPVQLNLTALMDILSNLLFFLLASFGATIVMAINATVPVQSADKSDVADTNQTVTVNVKISRAGYEVTPMGMVQTEEQLAPLRRVIPNKGDQLDYKTFTKQLLAIKQRFPKSDTVILTPEPGISYDGLIRTMDAARESEVELSVERKTIPLFPTVVVSTVVK
jgi:biopolymer transport protein ExbD